MGHRKQLRTPTFMFAFTWKSTGECKHKSWNLFLVAPSCCAFFYKAVSAKRARPHHNLFIDELGRPPHAFCGNYSRRRPFPKLVVEYVSKGSGLSKFAAFPDAQTKTCLRSVRGGTPNCVASYCNYADLGLGRQLYAPHSRSANHPPDVRSPKNM